MLQEPPVHGRHSRHTFAAKTAHCTQLGLVCMQSAGTRRALRQKGLQLAPAQSRSAPSAGAHSRASGQRMRSPSCCTISPRALAAASGAYSPVSVSWYEHSNDMQAPLHARHAAICSPMTVTPPGRLLPAACAATCSASPREPTWRAGSSRCSAARTAAAAAARRAACCPPASQPCSFAKQY